MVFMIYICIEHNYVVLYSVKTLDIHIHILYMQCHLIISQQSLNVQKIE